MLICGDLLLIVFTHYYAHISACFLQCNDAYHGSSYRLATSLCLIMQPGSLSLLTPPIETYVN